MASPQPWVSSAVGPGCGRASEDGAAIQLFKWTSFMRARTSSQTTCGTTKSQNGYHVNNTIQPLNSIGCATPTSSVRTHSRSPHKPSWSRCCCKLACTSSRRCAHKANSRCTADIQSGLHACPRSLVGAKPRDEHAPTPPIDWMTGVFGETSCSLYRVRSPRSRSDWKGHLQVPGGDPSGAVGFTVRAT